MVWLVMEKCGGHTEVVVATELQQSVFILIHFTDAWCPRHVGHKSQSDPTLALKSPKIYKASDFGILLMESSDSELVIDFWQGVECWGI